MNDTQQEKQNEQPQEQYESYGWEFHKVPLLYAAILTAIFYAFVFIYFNI